jgi:hypothetical protein
MSLLFHKWPFYITLICLFIPIIQVLIEHPLNRFILIISILLYPLSLRAPRVSLSIFLIFLTIFAFTILGLSLNRGFLYSANSSPLIFGLIFYLYFKYKINPFEQFYIRYTNTIYKILLLFMLVELIATNIGEHLFNTVIFSFLANPVINGYVHFISKLSYVLPFEFEIYGNNSLYLGNQIYSMICVSAVAWFFPYDKNYIDRKNTKWLLLSIFLFITGFSFTSIIMLFTWIILAILLIPQCRKSMTPILYISLIIFSAITMTFFLSTTVEDISRGFDSRGERYFNNFIGIVESYFNELPLEYQIFGIPSSQSYSDYAQGAEFGYFIRMYELGFIYNILIGGLNVFCLIYVYIKRKSQNTFAKINLIIITVWHLSMIHYMPALNTGPAQLFGLHISLFILFCTFGKRKFIFSSTVNKKQLIASN